MHILIGLGVALKIWMLVDAIGRGAESYWFFIIVFAPFGEFIYFFMVKMRDFDFAGGAFGFRSARKCGTCKHCVAMFEDGVRCGAGGGEPIFRTNVHVDYCTHYEKG